ncbi:MAG: hypothetical protein KME26_04215 [Oscillatoria princeps RMCB-10]|jgi:hypothetical protein|nr:hypothetical protein [Oscillatoria princeps RMCB-10]
MMIEKVNLYLLPPQYLLTCYKLSQPVAASVRLALEQFQQALTVNSLPQAISLTNAALPQLKPVETIPLPEKFATGTPLNCEEVKELNQYMEVEHVKAKEPAKLIIASVLKAYLGFLEMTESLTFDPADVKLVAAGFQSYASLLARVFNVGSAGSRNDITPEFLAPLTQLFPESATSQLVREESLRTNTLTNTENVLLRVWKRGHWVFFVLTQGLTLCFRRLAAAVRSGDLDIAKIELETASELMWASGASMKLTGNFSKQEYLSQVRPTMTRGHVQSLVQSVSLSGVMTWDHDYLVNVVWKKELLSVFQKLPNSLQAEHEKFVRAYKEGLSAGHKSVCVKFGGDTMGSLRDPHNIAADTLEKFEQSRLRLIAPL